MKKQLIRILILLFTFIGAVVVFEFLTNQVKEDQTAAMADPGLPVISFNIDGSRVNELHGYTTEMDTALLRGTVTPIGEERSLQVEMQTFSLEIISASYEIRSLDGSTLMADGELNGLQGTGEVLTDTILIPTILEDDTEYQLILTAIDRDQRTCRFYTRLMRSTDCDVDACFQFAREFHENSLLDGQDSYFASYMETVAGASSSGLDYVDLTGSLNQILWGSFQGEVVTDPVINFEEINTSYNVITIDYVMSAAGTDGKTDYYNVEEYYRLRQGETRIYVLNFERTMNQIFRSDSDYATEDGSLLLGIRNSDVDYVTDETGTIVCFVQEGDLWSYNSAENTLTCIFSFRNSDGMDIRSDWDDHEIRVVRVNEAGSVDFLVFGYMNRGNHEGRTGTCIYHYDALMHENQEEAFIPSDADAEILEAEMGQLLYENDQQELYLMLDGSFYRTDLTTMTTTCMIPSLKSGCYCVSEDQRYLAWVDPDRQYASETVSVLDMKTGKTQEVEAEAGEYILPITYTQDDLVCGLALKSDVEIDSAGMQVFPMNLLKILSWTDDSFEVLKTYQPEGCYVGSVDVINYTLQLTLVRETDGQYLPYGTDIIMNKDANNEDKVEISTVTDAVRQDQVVLKLKNAAVASDAYLLTTEEVIGEEIPEVTIQEKTEVLRYYVYAKGHVLLATDDSSEAISMADANMGVVVDSRQQYTWMRARKTRQNSFSDAYPMDEDRDSSTVDQCLSAVLKHEGCEQSVSQLRGRGCSTPEEILTAGLGEDTVILSLSGLATEDLLFYISKGNPVLAMTGSDTAVLITGYSSSDITYYDPQLDYHRTVSFTKADALFAEGGLRFLAYLN